MSGNITRIQSEIIVALLLGLGSAVYAAPAITIVPRDMRSLQTMHNGGLQKAINAFSGGANASGTAQVYYELDNPDAYCFVGDGAIGNLSLAGEWGFGINGGDPNTPVDDGFPVIGATRSAIYDAVANKEFSIGETGQMLTSPHIDPKTQTAGFVWTTNDPVSNIKVEYKANLVRDVLYYEYDITNLNQNFRRIGLKVMYLNPTFSGASNISPTYYLPTLGSYNNVQEFIGPQVPDEWFERDGTPLIAPDFHPPLLWKQVFSGNNTKPERLAFGNYKTANDDISLYGWFSIYNTNLPGTTNPKQLIRNGDPFILNKGSITYATLYPINSIGNGGTQVIKGQIQLNWSAVNTYGQLAAAVQAPEWIGYNTSNNATGTATNSSFYETSDVVVNAYLCNSAQLSDTLATVAIDTGTGFDLAAGQNAINSNISVGQLIDKQLSWHLVPNGKASGLLPVRITATFNPGNTITATTYVNVPALPTRNFAAGTHFVGLPFQFTDSRPTALFSNLGTDPRLAWYDPTTGNYLDGATDSFSIQPGRGYWLNSVNPMTFSAQNVAPLDQKKPYQVQLNSGWNSISNPYQFSIVWGYCEVLYNNQLYSLNDAIRIGLIRAELWSWDDTNSQYNPPTNPSPNNQPDQEIKPNIGYWLFAGDTVSLVFTPNPYVAVMDATVPQAKNRTRAAGQTNQWQVNIVADAGGAFDRNTTFGVSPDGKNGNVMKPPISPAGLSAYFPHANWGRMSGQYAYDLQAPGDTQVWALDINCTKKNETVTVRWPDLTGAPAKMPLILTDLLTGQQISMRTSPNFSFNSGSTGGIRHFTITAGGSLAALQFTQVQASPNRGRGGMLITYGLTAQADVKVNLRTSTGRLIRTLETTRASGGLNTVNWDGKDNQGRLLPRGFYLCELYAEATDGQRIRASLTLSNN